MFSPPKKNSYQLALSYAATLLRLNYQTRMCALVHLCVRPSIFARPFHSLALTKQSNKGTGQKFSVSRMRVIAKTTGLPRLTVIPYCRQFPYYIQIAIQLLMFFPFILSPIYLRYFLEMVSFEKLFDNTIAFPGQTEREWS